MQSAKLFRWLLIPVLLVAFWLRVFDLNTIPPGMHRDEGNYLYRQWRLTYGYGLPLYFQDNPEPFDSMVRAVFLRFAGVLPFTSRLFSIFLNVVAAAAAAAAARTLFHDHPYREAIALTAAVALTTATPTAVIGRSIYRANWLPMASTLSLAFLARGWLTHRRRYYVAAGIAGAIAASFYLGGLVFPIALGVSLVVSIVLNRKAFPGWRSLLAMAAAGAITMIPWFYLFLRVPNWLNWRLTEVSQGVNVPVNTPDTLLQAVERAIKPIFVPVQFYDDIRYSTFTTGYISSLPLAILCVVGIVACLWRWRRVGTFLPLIAAVVMIMPSVFSDAPETAVRMLGVFGPLAILSGLGAGAILQLANAQFLSRTCPANCQAELRSAVRLRNCFAIPIASRVKARHVAQIGLLAILVYSPVYLYTQVRYHFLEQPLIHDDPTSWLSLAGYYNLGALDMWKYVVSSSKPIYIPIDYLNGEVPASWLRPNDFPNMHGYAGQALPPGEIILPVNDVYGLPATPYPIQYALMLPATGEIVVLPPLALTDAETLRQRLLNEGKPFTNDPGWLLGHTLAVDAQNNPFDAVQYVNKEGSLGIFDDHLELVDVEMPREMQPGGWIPVTLYWRLNKPSGQDYFANVQIWDSSGNSRSNQNGAIFRFIYPTPMWSAGNIVAETRWLQLFNDAPQGGYRLMVQVYVHPGPIVTPLVAAPGVHQQDQWLVAAHPLVPLPPFPEPPSNALPVDAQLADSIRLTNATFDPPLEALKAGDSVKVTLYWQAYAPPPDDYTLFLHLKDADGNLLADFNGQPFDGQYPTSNWRVGERVVTTHTLTLKADGKRPYQLAVGMYSYPSLERVTVLQDGAPAKDNLVVIR